MLLHPMPRDVDPARDPHVLMPHHVVEQALQPGGTGGMADQPHVQADRHHLRVRGTLLAQHVEGVADKRKSLARARVADEGNRRRDGGAWDISARLKFRIVLTLPLYRCFRYLKGINNHRDYFRDVIDVADFEWQIKRSCIFWMTSIVHHCERPMFI